MVCPRQREETGQQGTSDHIAKIAISAKIAKIENHGIPLIPPGGTDSTDMAMFASAATHTKDNQIEIRVAGDSAVEVRRDRNRQRALARLRKLSRPLPPGFVFDREEANAP